MEQLALKVVVLSLWFNAINVCILMFMGDASIVI